MAKQSRPGGGIVELIKTIVYALLIAGVFRTLFFQPFWIPSGSMKDDAADRRLPVRQQDGLRLFAHSCPFSICPFEGRILASEPERGDVVGVPPSGHGRGLHQAAGRAAGRPDPDGRGRPAHQRRAGAAGACRPVRRAFNEPQGPIRSLPDAAPTRCRLGGDCEKERFHRDAARAEVAHAILDIDDAARRQRRCSRCPEGPLLLHGRQPRQQTDSRVMPAAAGSASCRSRT
jgi:signal peptidase I